MKTCSACEVSKPRSEFGKNSCKPDGLCAACRVCRNLRRKAQYYKDPAASIAAARKWNLENPKAFRRNAQTSYVRHSERRKELAREAYAANKGRMNASNRAYRHANPEVCRAIKAKRRAAKLQRTPKWLTREDLAEIKGIYAEARRREKETGEPHHVDHVYPLQGRLVSGLHVPSNLQILSARENLTKNNNWFPE